MDNVSMPQYDTEIKRKIKSLVAESQTSDALALLLELSKPNRQVHDAIHIVLGEFNELTSSRLRGTIDNGEATRRLNIIHDKILIALNSFDSKGVPLPSSVISGSGQTTKFLLKLGLSTLGVALVIGVIFFVLNQKEKGDSYIALMIAAYYIGSGGILVLGGWFLALVVNALKGK
jgi:hypothetical protein